jgi:hypothetical protein
VTTSQAGKNDKWHRSTPQQISQSLDKLSATSRTHDVITMFATSLALAPLRAAPANPRAAASARTPTTTRAVFQSKTKPKTVAKKSKSSAPSKNDKKLSQSDSMQEMGGIVAQVRLPPHPGVGLVTRRIQAGISWCS